MAGRIQWEAQVDSNVAKLLSETKELRDQLDGIKKGNYEIKLNIDDKKLEKVISNLDKMLESLGKGTGDFKEFENLSKQLNEIVSEVKELHTAFGGINDSGVSNLLSSIQSIDKSLSSLSEHIISVNKDFGSVGKNASDNVSQINEAKKATEGLTEATKELANAQKNVGNKSNISSGNDIKPQIKQWKEYNDLVAVGYDRILKMKKISESGTVGNNSVYDLLRLNHEAWDEVKANNFFNTIPEQGLKRYDEILKVVEKIVKKMLEVKGLTEEQVVKQLSDIKSAQGGNFKANGHDSGWSHFATYSNNAKDKMYKENGLTYKVYAAFENIEDLNKDIVSSIMKELTKAGFKGRLKTTTGSTSLADKLNGLAITDQMVVHGSTKKDQEIAYNVLKKMGLNLSYLGGGIDTPDGSFSQTLQSGNIEKYVKLLNQEAQTAEKTAKSELELANARKESASQTPIKDTFQGGAKSSAESSAPAVKEEAKAMEQVAENAEKASKGKEKFAKANKNVKASADASTGSIEKENSALDEKVWEKNLKVIQEYMDANTKLNKLNAKDKGTGKHASDIARQEKEVEKLRESAIEARAELSSMVNPHEAPIDDWGKWVEVMEKFEQATKGSAESVAKLEDALRSARNAQLSSIDSTINNSQSKLDNFSARKAQSDAYKNSLIELGETIERLRTLRASLSNTRAFTDEEQTQIQALTKSVHEYINTIKNMPAVEKGSDALSRDKWANRIREYMDKNTRLTREFREELENLIRILRTGGDSVVLKDVIGQFEDAKFRIKEAKLEGKSFFDIFKDKAVYGFAAKLANYYLSFYDFIRYARYAINALVELDSALLDLKKTTSMTENQLEDFYYTSNDVAKRMGVTTADIIEQASAWSRFRNRPPIW